MLLIRPDDLPTPSDFTPTITPTPDACPAPVADEPPRKLSPAQSALAGEHFHLVAQVLRSYLRETGRHSHGTDADDLESAGVAGLMRAALAFDPTDGRPFRPFASVSIKNAMRDADDTLTRQRRRDEFAAFPGTLDDKGGVTAVDHAPPPSASMEDDELAEGVGALLDSLPAPLRDVAELLKEGLSLSKIAKRLGISKAGVQKRLDKIRKRAVYDLRSEP